MKCLSFFLILIFSQISFSQQVYKFSPVSTKLTLPSYPEKEKIKVGFIDSGLLFENGSIFKGIKVSQIMPYEKSEDVKYIHAGLVVRTFLQKLSISEIKRIEIVYCHTSRATNMVLNKCLDHMEEEKVDLLNISLEILDLSEKEKEGLKILTSRGVIISVAAGNSSSKVDEDSLCGLRMNNKVCIGGVEYWGIQGKILSKFATKSNYGPLVDAYENYYVQISNENYKINEQGTSFSSPLFLAKILKQRLERKNFDFKLHYEEIAKSNNREYVPYLDKNRKIAGSEK